MEKVRNQLFFCMMDEIENKTDEGDGRKSQLHGDLSDWYPINI